jgi:hypothetical protein
LSLRSARRSSCSELWAWFSLIVSARILRFVMAVAIRVVMGGLLWWLAEDLRHTPFMRILAVIAIFAAVGILLMGQGRLNTLVDWWLSRSDGLLRFSALLAAVFGAYLVYVAV